MRENPRVWIIGIGLLLLVTSAGAMFAGRRQVEAPPAIWELPGTSRSYTGIVGTLAGFSVGGSIFIANLSLARESPAFESLMAMFLVAFLIFISASMQFVTTPNLAEPPGSAYETIQAYSYVLANLSFYLGLCLSWLGLPLLLVAVGLPYLGDLFIWIVLFAIVGGALRISGSGLNLLARVDYKLSFAVPLACFAGTAVYYLGLGEILEDLLPMEHRAALFAAVSFVVAAAGFSLQSTLVGALRDGASTEVILPFARPAVLGLSAAAFTSTALLWLAVRDSI